MRPNLTKHIGLAGGVAALMVVSLASAETMLKASHQFPGGKDDPRDEMVQIVAREVEAADVGLKVRVYPGSSLFKPHDQWPALVKGQLDITTFPLVYASSFHPQFEITSMPAVPRSHDHAKRLNESEFMEDLEKIIEEGGAKVIAHGWLSGGFASTEDCILMPDDVKGDVTRAGGSAFERMLAAAGASISSIPSSEIYTALQTGVLDSTMTSTGSFISFRIYELAKCLTAPGENTLWLAYEPILISNRTWDKLSKEQQDALIAAGQKAEEYFFEATQQLDEELVETFKKAGVEVVTLNDEQFKAWRDLAERTAYQHFRENVPGGAELLDKALAVE